MSLSSETINSGRKANRTGNALERFTLEALQARGYLEFWHHKPQVLLNRSIMNGKQYIRQIQLGLTIYGTPRKADFLVINRKLFPDDLVIECKWQQSRGSVDEKYPYLLYNIIRNGIPTVILLDGGGYKPLALTWLKSMVNKSSALIAVWTMAELQREVNNGFLG